MQTKTSLTGGAYRKDPPAPLTLVVTYTVLVTDEVEASQGRFGW